MIINYIGHACFVISGSKKIIIDPYFGKNKKAAAFHDYDFILLSHGHGDHLGEALKIAENSCAPILAIVELANLLYEEGTNAIGFNIGGSYKAEDLEIKMMPAWHSSSYNYQGKQVYAGPAVSYIIRIDGLCFYYAGDTALFYDMKTVIAREKIDIAFLPIGDYYTMGIDDAVTAADWLKAKKVIPMHYNTFPNITQDVNSFKNKINNQTQSECIIINPGEEITF